VIIEDKNLLAQNSAEIIILTDVKNKLESQLTVAQSENDTLRTLLENQVEKFRSENEKLIEKNSNLIQEKEFSETQFKNMFESTLADRSEEQETKLAILNKEIEQRGAIIAANRNVTYNSHK
jgi:hypothetical protein